MKLSQNLLSEFVKTTNDMANDKQSSVIYGTAKIQNGEYFVQLDGSNVLTPVNVTAEVKDGERVVVDIHNHEATISGNLTYPAARTETVNVVDRKVDQLNIDKLSVADAEIDYAKIDMANIGIAAIEKIFSDSGIINELVIKEGKVTGELVGVVIKGDLIEGNTIAAEKLIVKGDDGLYYQLNVNGEKVESKQTEYNSLDGRILVAKSVVASKIDVDDLFAQNITATNFNITGGSVKIETSDNDGDFINLKNEEHIPSTGVIAKNQLFLSSGKIEYSREFTGSNANKYSMIIYPTEINSYSSYDSGNYTNSFSIGDSRANFINNNLAKGELYTLLVDAIEGIKIDKKKTDEDYSFHISDYGIEFEKKAGNGDITEKSKISPSYFDFSKEDSGTGLLHKIVYDTNLKMLLEKADLDDSVRIETDIENGTLSIIHEHDDGMGTVIDSIVIAQDRISIKNGDREMVYGYQGINSVGNGRLIHDNGSNLWIGATSTANNHYNKGNVYISTGTNDETIFISALGGSETRSNYGVRHKGNDVSGTVSISSVAAGGTATSEYIIIPTALVGANPIVTATCNKSYGNVYVSAINTSGSNTRIRLGVRNLSSTSEMTDVTIHYRITA